MPFYLKLLSFVFAMSFLITFFTLIRKKTVKPFYSTSWLLISLFMISVVVFEGFYKWIATLLGLADASFLIIVSLISFLLIYVLYLSIKISEMGDRIQELISFTAILEKDLREKVKTDETKVN